MRTVRPAWSRHKASRRNGKRSYDQSMTTHTNHVSVCDSWALLQCYGFFTLVKTYSETYSKPNGYIVLCKTFHITKTRTRIPTPYFCIGQESESVPVSKSGDVFKPLSGIVTIFVSYNCSVMRYRDEEEAEDDVSEQTERRTWQTRSPDLWGSLPHCCHDYWRFLVVTIAIHYLRTTQ